jgi:pimeloyl-ACP methyl ester carboxylesterase
MSKKKSYFHSILRGLHLIMSSIFIRIALIGLLLAADVTGVFAQNKPETPGRSWRKAVPEITWKNISPPFKDYRYYEHVEVFPFEHKSKAFSPINAWWLSEAATLVYADEDFVRIRFRKAGMSQVVYFNKDSTQCFVASNDKFALVVFRGSEIWKKTEKFNLAKVLADLMTDVDIRLVKWEQGGKVHRGFNNALDEVWDDLAMHIDKLHRKGLKIWFGGHSLGAALATLAADRCPYAAGVYTIGSPRVGDRDFRDRYHVQAHRIVNNSDIVAKVPPKGFYRHVGEIRFIDDYGIVHDRIPKAGKENIVIKHEPRDNYESDDQFRGGLQGLVPDAFRDHVPVIYTVHLWNHLVVE